MAPKAEKYTHQHRTGSGCCAEKWQLIPSIDTPREYTPKNSKRKIDVDYWAPRILWPAVVLAAAVGNYYMEKQQLVISTPQKELSDKVK